MHIKKEVREDFSMQVGAAGAAMLSFTIQQYLHAYMHVRPAKCLAAHRLYVACAVS
jgi:hypothetical protein